MTLPSEMVDTYRKYKKGTDSFVNWLAQTARATGKANSILPSMPDGPKQGGGRLKGKARKEAKQTGQATNTTRSTLAVQITNLPRLAKIVADTAVLEVPHIMLITLQEVIKSRKECAEWYRYNTDHKDTAADNKSHWHFINVLAQVHDTLQSKQKKLRAEVKDTSKKMKNSSFENIFEQLELEETSELDDIPGPVLKRDTQEQTDFKLESTEADISFAVYCFLQDMTRLRLYVRRTWRDFRLRTTSLEAASMVTNAAMAMLQKESNDFLEAFPQFGAISKPGQLSNAYQGIVNFLWKKQSKQDEGSLVSSESHVEEDYTGRYAFSDGVQVMDLCEMLCLHTASMVGMVFNCPSLDINQLPLSADERRFVKTLQQTTMVKEEWDQNFGYNYIREAIKLILLRAHVDPWQIFVVQILWDTQRETETAMTLAHVILRTETQRKIAKYNEFFAADDLHSLGTWCIHRLDEFRNVVDGIHSIALDDRFQENLNEHETCTCMRFKPLKYPNISILANNPIICGNVLMRCHYHYDRWSTIEGNNEGYLLVAAHLYNAARQTTGSDGGVPEWKDMEHFIQKQGNAWFYVGSRPQHKSDFARRLNIVLGASATNYAKEKRASGCDSHDAIWFQSERKCRRMEFAGRWGELGVVRDKIKKITSHSRARDNDLVMLNWLVKDSMPANEKAESLSATQLLDRYKAAIEQDLDSYRFDVMGLYLQSFKLLRRVQLHCMKHSPYNYRRSLCSGDIGLVVVVGLMLELLKGGRVCVKPMFQDAVQIVKEEVNDSGSLLVTEMKNASRHRAHITGKEVQLEEKFVCPAEDQVPLFARDELNGTEFEDDDGYFCLPQNDSRA